MQLDEQIAIHDKELFECIVIKKTISDDTYLSSIIEYLKVSYFSDESCKFFVSILQNFYKKYNRKPSLSEIKSINNNEKVKKHLDKINFRTQGIDVDSISDDFIYEETQTYLRQQAVFSTLWDVVDKLENKKLHEDNVYELFEKACSIQLSIDLGFDVFDKFTQYLNELDKTDRFIKTGFKWLDEKLNGGYLENGKSLYLFVGATNVGKSIFLSNTATACLKQNKKVLVISFEMSELIYTSRVVSSCLGFPINSLHNYKEILQQRKNEFKETYPDSRLLIKEFPPSTVTCSQLKAYIKQVSTKLFKPDIVILDYINLIAPTQGNNSYERIKYIAEHVRAMTYEFKCPFITASQLNRTGISISSTAQDAPGLEYLSESIALAATCDGVFPIWKTEEDIIDDTIHLGITKSRAGKNTGITRLRCEYDTLSLVEDETLNNTDHVDSSEDSAIQFSTQL